MANDLTPEFIARVNAITAKRARTIVQHILRHGHITTEEISRLYGYQHPPRAARDVKEEGIPLETFHVNVEGRNIAAYRFGSDDQLRHGRSGGRRSWPSRFKDTLVKHYGQRCGICSVEFEPMHLQIDHRVPYEVAGNIADMEPANFMLICASCNRLKSWSCEHCSNWTTDHIASVCSTCYWASPNEYSHVAMRLLRRLEIVWEGGKEAQLYEALLRIADDAGEPLPEFAKRILNSQIEEQ